MPFPERIETKRCGNVLIFLAVSAFDDALRSPETTGKEEPTMAGGNEILIHVQSVLTYKHKGF